MGYMLKVSPGGLWDDPWFHVEFDCEADGHACPHERDGIVPRVIVASNEGGFNSTGVCLDCVLDAERTGVITKEQ